MKRKKIKERLVSKYSIEKQRRAMAELKIEEKEEREKRRKQQLEVISDRVILKGIMD